MKNSPCCNSITGRQIATNICTCHGSTVILCIFFACANFVAIFALESRWKQNESFIQNFNFDGNPFNVKGRRKGFHTVNALLLLVVVIYKSMLPLLALGHQTTAPMVVEQWWRIRKKLITCGRWRSTHQINTQQNLFSIYGICLYPGLATRLRCC